VILPGQGLYRLLPEVFQVFIRCFEIKTRHDFSAYHSCRIVDDHVITAEVLAGAGTRGIHGTGKPRLIPVFSQERARLWIYPIRKGLGEEFRMFGGNMYREQFFRDPVPAIVMPV
jgi:hypothetical protein